MALILWLPDGRIAIFERAQRAAGGLTLVGGLLEGQELWQEGAVRTLHEETCINIPSERVRLAYTASTKRGLLVIGHVRIELDELECFRSTRRALRCVVVWPAEVFSNSLLDSAEQTAGLRAFMARKKG